MTETRTEPNVVAIGTSRCGKSEGEAVDVLRLALLGLYAIVVLDRHGSLARKIATHIIAQGLEQRLIYEKVSSNDGKYLRWQMLLQSQVSDPIVRRQINDLTVEEIAQVFYARRMQKEVGPYTKRYLVAPLNILLYHPEPVPLRLIRKLYQPDSPEFRHLIDATEHREAAEMMLSAVRQGPRQWEILTGASDRLTEILDSPVIWTRDGGTFSWKEAIGQKSIICVDGSGLVELDAVRTLFILMSQAALNESRRHFNVTEKKLHLVLVLDEAGAMDLVTPFVLMAMQELQKAGVSVHVLSQSTHDFKGKDANSDEVLEQLLANAGIIHAYRQVSPASVEKLAKVLASPTWRNDIEHHRRERMEFSHYERIETSSTSHNENKSLRDHKSRTHGHSSSTSHSEHFLAQHKPKEEIVYKNPSTHVEDIKAKLTTQAPGQRHTADWQGVRQERVTMLERPWSDLGDETIDVTGMEGDHLFPVTERDGVPGRWATLETYYVQTALHRVRSRPIFQPPPPCPENNEQISSVPSTPEVIQLPQTRRAAGGMRGS